MLNCHGSYESHPKGHGFRETTLYVFLRRGMTGIIGTQRHLYKSGGHVRINVSSAEPEMAVIVIWPDPINFLAITPK